MGDEERAELAIAGICEQLARLVNDRPFRFKETSRADADAFLESMTRFRGAAPADIVAREKVLGAQYSAVFRCFLARMGEEAGALFRGSKTGLSEHVRLRAAARAMLTAEDPSLTLPSDAEVFLVHQGYSFRYAVAKGGYDDPVFIFCEGDGAPVQEAATFVDMLASELSLMEANDRRFREQGGYYVTVRDGAVTEEYPARADGVRPLDGPDRYLD